MCWDESGKTAVQLERYTFTSLDSFLPWEEGKGQRYYHTHCWGLTMLRLNPPNKPPKYAISHFGPFKLSGWFISFPWFCLIITKIWSKGPKRVEQTSYSSVQLKQTDLLLAQHSQRSPPHLFYWSCLASHFILPVSSFWLRLVQSRACTHHQPVKENANGHMLKADWQL